MSQTSDLDALVSSLTLQRFLLVHREWADARWLPMLDRSGLFTSPPGVEVLPGGGMRAVGWPALTYLERVADEAPDRVASILMRLDSSNWWVIADGLQCANRLPQNQAAAPTLHLLEQWARSAVRWTRPEVLMVAIGRVASEIDTSSRVPQVVLRLCDALWEGPEGRYELEEILRGVGHDLSIDARSLVADGIELSLVKRLQSRTSWRGYGRRLGDRSDSSDTADLLASQWIELTEREAQDLGAGFALVRAVRLLAAGEQLLFQMGLRALRHALDQAPTDPLGVDLLERVLRDEDLFQAEGVISELLPLVSTHWPCASLSVRARLLERVTTAATSYERRDRYYARDWLRALNARLGARESLCLQSLEAELGPGRESFSRPRVIAGFIGSRGPIAAEDLRALAVSDLLSLMRSVPVERERDFVDSSVEGLAALIRDEVERRPAEFAPFLDEIASTVPYAAILYHVILGFEAAFKKETSSDGEMMSVVLSFLVKVSRRAASGQIGDDESRGYSGLSVLKAAADFVEDLAASVVQEGQGTELVDLCRMLCDANDPVVDAEVGSHVAEMDPPTLALNNVRGRATRATLALLSNYWGADGVQRNETYDALKALLQERVESESSPSVRSAFGLHLARLIVYERDWWVTNREAILPARDDQGARWEAVFTTFLVYTGPHRLVAHELAEDYVLAVERVGDDSFSFFRLHVDRLVAHLIALSLPPDEEWRTWLEELLRALARADDSTAGHAITSFAHALRREAIEVEQEWLLTLVRFRLRSIARDTPSRSHEATGLLSLLMAGGDAVRSIGGEVLGLLYAGGKPRADELLEFLDKRDVDRSGIGAQILAAAAAQGIFENFNPDPARLTQLILDYARGAPRLMWELVNTLGEAGFFDLEDVALSLIRDLENEREDMPPEGP